MDHLFKICSCIVFVCVVGLHFVNSELSTSKDTQNFKLSPEEIVRLEFEEFEKEMEEFSKITKNEEMHSRKKRTVLFNPWTAINLGLLLGIPFTVILPTLTNFFNWKWKRSADEDLENIEFEDDPVVQPHLDRISTYFELIKIPEKSCQERAICEFSADPEKYYPISELILNRVRNPSLPVIAYLEEETEHIFNKSQSENIQREGTSLFKLYSKAADRGLAYGSRICKSREFADKCPHSIEKRLNMPVLQFWNLLSSALKFSMRDDIVI